MLTYLGSSKGDPRPREPSGDLIAAPVSIARKGWFGSRDKVVQDAIRRFMEAHQPELMERFIREDVEWGLRGQS